MNARFEILRYGDSDLTQHASFSVALPMMTATTALLKSNLRDHHRLRGRVIRTVEFDRCVRTGSALLTAPEPYRIEDESAARRVICRVRLRSIPCLVPIRVVVNR